MCIKYLSTYWSCFRNVHNSYIIMPIFTNDMYPLDTHYNKHIIEGVVYIYIEYVIFPKDSQILNCFIFHFWKSIWKEHPFVISKHATRMWFMLVPCNSNIIIIEILTFACLLIWVSRVFCLQVEMRLMFYNLGACFVVIHDVIGHPLRFLFF